MLLTRETRTGLRLTVGATSANENYTNIWDIMLGILFKIFPPGIGILCWKYFLLFFAGIGLCARNICLDFFVCAE